MTEIGRNVPRVLTDVAGIVLYFLCWVFMWVLAIVAFKEGNIQRVLKGSDYNGNICGEGTPLGLSISQDQWARRTLLWYPITYDVSTRSFLLTSALHMGVCVESCPTFRSTVLTYGGEGSGIPSSWVSLFNSSVTFQRCLPVLSTFGCGFIPGGSAGCAAAIGGASTELSNLLGIGQFFHSFASMLNQVWVAIVVLSFLTIVLCFLWLFVLRKLVKAITILSVGMAFALAIVIIALLGDGYKHSTGESANFYLAMIILACVLLVLMSAVLLYLWKDLMLSCDVIEEGSKVVVQVPWVVGVPVANALFLLGNAGFFSLVAVAVYTVSTSQNVASTYIAANGTAVTATTHIFEAGHGRTLGLLYTVFMFLWSSGNISAITYMVIAFVGVQWYWSAPGSEKQPPDDSVRWSVKTTLRFHTGTLAMGSLLVALVQFARFLLRLVEKRMSAVVRENRAARFVLCLCDCVLACFERVLKFLTHQAYIVVAMTGQSLFPAARRGLSLAMSTPAVWFIGIVADVVIVVGKILISGTIMCIGYLWIRAQAPQGTRDNFAGAVAFLGIIAYFIATLFSMVLLVSVDTTMLCFCCDREINNGQERPYFAPTDLQQYIDGANARRRGAGKAASAPLLTTKAPPVLL